MASTENWPWIGYCTAVHVDLVLMDVFVYYGYGWRVGDILSQRDTQSAAAPQPQPITTV